MQSVNKIKSVISPEPPEEDLNQILKSETPIEEVKQELKPFERYELSDNDDIEDHQKETEVGKIWKSVVVKTLSSIEKVKEKEKKVIEE